MDGRTQQLFDALRDPGGAFLFELVSRGELTEAVLHDAAPDTSQATANRRLRELGRLGVLKRAPGGRQQKNRPWAVSAVGATDAFLEAAIELSRTIALKEDADREDAAGELRKARRDRSGLAIAEHGSARSS